MLDVLRRPIANVAFLLGLAKLRVSVASESPSPPPEDLSSLFTVHTEAGILQGYTTARTVTLAQCYAGCAPGGGWTGCVGFSRSAGVSDDTPSVAALGL